MNKLKAILRLVTINLVILAILLILTNWLVGIYLRKTGEQPRSELLNYDHDREHARKVFKDYNSLSYTYEPFVGWQVLPYQGETTTISKEGLRTHPFPGTGEPEKVVRFFGGSTIWGEGSDDQHTIPALFNQQFPNYEVHNHGQLAYNSRQNLDAMITLLEEKVAMDLVIFYDGVNDAAFLCPSDVDVPGHRLVPMFRGKLYSGNKKIFFDVLNKVFTENIIRLSQRINPADKSRLYNCLSDPEKAEAIAEFLLTNWEIAHELTTSRGGRFIAVLQPGAYVGQPRTDHLNLGPELGKNFVHVYDLLQKKIRDRGHDWIYDLTGSFDGDNYIYIDFCHVSPNGNKIIADQISEIVRTSYRNDTLPGADPEVYY